VECGKLEHRRIIVGNEKGACGVVIATRARKSTGLARKQSQDTASGSVQMPPRLNCDKCVRFFLLVSQGIRMDGENEWKREVVQRKGADALFVLVSHACAAFLSENYERFDLELVE
jgi:hypothetical protein